MIQVQMARPQWRGRRGALGKRSRIALRWSALASNHRGGNGLAALKMYVTVRTVHGAGGACWLAWELSSDQMWQRRLDRTQAREKDLVRLYGSTAGGQEEQPTPG